MIAGMRIPPHYAVTCGDIATPKAGLSSEQIRFFLKPTMSAGSIQITR